MTSKVTVTDQPMTDDEYQQTLVAVELIDRIVNDPKLFETVRAAGARIEAIGRLKRHHIGDDCSDTIMDIGYDILRNCDRLRSTLTRLHSKVQIETARRARS